MSFSKRLDRRKIDNFSLLSGEFDSVTSKFIYFISGSELKVYFSKEFKSFFRHSLQPIYPRFVGKIESKDFKSTIKGTIGVYEYYWWIYIIWIIPFGYMYTRWLFDENSFSDGEISLYFILFGILLFLIGLIVIRKRVESLRQEIEDIVYSQNIE